MWGTRQNPKGPYCPDRFIPTHVGNACRPRNPRRRSAVHPHACGERIPSLQTKRFRYGSSPRMWGTHPAREPVEVVRRFIPTHVGNATARGMRTRPWPVHPHACGERKSQVKPSGTVNGSSPRMWGTHHFPDLPLRQSRFIPTHVGNALSTSPGYGAVSVHPHACGERRPARGVERPDHGSSPRMWGTLIVSYILLLLLRFIPTHVGNATP